MFLGSIKKKFYIWKRGGVTNITHNGKDYVARRFKRPICWASHHPALFVGDKYICTRCGKSWDREELETKIA